MARAATTEQILGGMPAVTPRVPSRWKRHFNRLAALRDYLLSQREDWSRDAREEQPGFGEHMADAATDSFDRDFALSMLSAEQDSLYEIEQAIRRIELGIYGVCEVTGKKIEAERLAALPWTRFSAEAARNLERHGEMKRPQVAQLGSVTASSPSTEAAANEDEGAE
jgi:RNA polymerase-binding transcription factor DksA